MVDSMRCRNCGAALDAGRIDRRLGIVVCEHCGGVHELGGAGADAPAGDRSPTPSARSAAGGAGPERGTVPLPERFDVHRGDSSLQVRWAKGNKSGALILAVFGVVWASAAISVGLFFLAPVALPILYYAAVRGVNRTELRASAGEVEIRSGPLPWRGARRHLRRSDIAQLFAREVVTRSSMDSRDGRKVQEYRSYAVEALDAAGKRRALIRGLASPEQALWFERELETLLGIENVGVAGELR